MSRKDFELIAHTISAIMNLEQRREVAELFATALQRTNSQFDRDRFVKVAMGHWS